MFNRQLPTVFIVEAIAPAGKRMADLKPYEIGLFDMETQRSVDAATYCSDVRYQFVWKSPSEGFITKFGGDERDAQMPIKSLPLGKIDKVHLFDEPKAEGEPFIGYLGWDSVSDCKTLEFECGKTYGLLIRARGENVRDVFGRNYEEYITFKTDCCTSCDVSVIAENVLDDMLAAIRQQSFYLNDFAYKVEKVSETCPAPDPFAKVDYEKYCLELCDAGDSHALAEVQRQYPDLDITRVARSGVISTYEFCQIATADAPADFVQSGATIPDCETCPTGFTLVEGGPVYLVEMAYDGVDPDHLGVVQAVYATATAATLLMTEAGVGKFQVTFPAAFDGTVIADTKLTSLGTQRAICTQDTPTSTAWTACGTPYKITRTLCLTIKNSDCNAVTPDLEALVAAYDGVGDVVVGSVAAQEAGDCVSVYTLNQYNNACLEDGCDTFGKDGAKFDEIADWNGVAWEMCQCEGWTVDGDGCPVPPADAEATNTRVGLKFTGAFLEPQSGRCHFNPFYKIPVNPITIEVSLIDQDMNPCDYALPPWTVVQRPTIAQGLGQFLMRDVIHSRMYDNQIYVNPDQKDGAILTNVLGYDFGVKPESLYAHIDLYHYTTSTRYAYQGDEAYRERISFAVEADNVTLFEQLKTWLNATALSHGVCRLAV